MSSAKVNRGVELFAQLDPHMQLTTLLTFLFVAQRGECIIKDVEVNLGLSNAAASRNISYWHDVKSHGVQGQGFIERYEDPSDRRKKLVRLTKQGREFYARLG